MVYVRLNYFLKNVCDLLPHINSPIAQGIMMIIPTNTPYLMPTYSITTTTEGINKHM